MVRQEDDFGLEDSVHFFPMLEIRNPPTTTTAMMGSREENAPDSAKLALVAEALTSATFATPAAWLVRFCRNDVQLKLLELAGVGVFGE